MNLDGLLIPLLFILGAAQGVFLSLALFASKAGNREANRYLGALTLVFSAALIDYVLDYTQLREPYIELRTLLWPKEFLYGALLYFYVREMTLPGRFALRGLQWLHLLPMFLHVLATWPILLFSSERQIAILDHTETELWPDWVFAFLLGDFETYTAMFQLSIYFWLCWKLLKHHRSHVENTFSYTDQVSLDWLRLLVTGIFVVYVIWIVEELLGGLLGMAGILRIALGVSMVALIYGMGYLGLRQPLIFNRGSEMPEVRQDVGEMQTEGVQEDKYKNSPLTPDLSKALLVEVRGTMSEGLAFLDSKLSLPDLADRLGVSVNYLSQTINEQAGQNFFDFVNSYRVDLAKKLLVESGKMNVLAIAMDSGFNSKSAFYNAFKKQTGMTPSEFRRQAIQDQQAA